MDPVVVDWIIKGMSKLEPAPERRNLADLLLTRLGVRLHYLFVSSNSRTGGWAMEVFRYTTKMFSELGFLPEFKEISVKPIINTLYNYRTSDPESFFRYVSLLTMLVDSIMDIYVKQSPNYLRPLG